MTADGALAGPVVRAGLPLVVVALVEEAHALPYGLPVLVTGAGKVNAALAVAAALAGPERPSEVVNLGTAGALHSDWDGLHVVGRVVQHDLDDSSLHRLTGRHFGPPIDLAPDESPAVPVLATGDVFVSDPRTRARLAEQADLVDMEGYAVAAACRAAGVPVRLVKHVSDDAGAGAARSWAATVQDCAEALAAWAVAHLRVPATAG